MTEKRKPKPWLRWVVVGLIILLVAYPASFGPAYWMVIRMEHQTAKHAFNIAYFPLVILACHNQTLADSARWYLHLGQNESRILFMNNEMVEFHRNSLFCAYRPTFRQSPFAQ